MPAKNATPPARGRLIVIEGIDGTGKSTHARLLAEWLRSRGREVIVEREPTAGPWGRRLRESGATGRLAAAEELDLFQRDRRAHVAQVIRPALAAGRDVVLDRYYFSTMAYQGARGIDPAEIRRQNEQFAPLPDLLLLLDLDVEAALARVGRRGDVANEFEQLESLRRCRTIFLEAANEPFARLIDAGAPLESVAARIRRTVAEWLDR